MDSPVKTLFLMTLLCLSGCAHSPVLISLDGTTIDEPSGAAKIEEDKEYPLLLKGLDGRPIDSLRPANPIGRYQYVVRAGRHQFWLKAITFGHPLFPEKVRCYVMEVELVPGARYRLRENTTRNSALLLNDDNGQTAATGILVDEPWVFSRNCDWHPRIQ